MIPLLLLLAIGGLMQAARSFSVDGGGTELAFGYLLLVAYFTAKLSSRIGLPKLTGYIIAGIVSGPFVLNLVTRDMADSLKVVSGVATCIIALTAGSELNLKKVKPVMKTLRSMTLFAVVGAMIVLTGTLFAMRAWLPFLDGMTTKQALAACLVVGVALSAQSPAVVMALLSETGSEGPLSQTILASVVVADLVVIVCYSIASSVASAVVGGGISVLDTTLSVVWELFGSIAFGIAIGMLFGIFLRMVKRGSSLFAVVVCVVVAEIGARVHLDPLVVMLAAGIWLENYSRADATELLSGFETAQLPVFLVFFALAGSHLNIFQLWVVVIPVAILVLTRATSFYVGCKIATATTHAEPLVAKYAWFGLCPQAGLALALALLVQNTFPTFGPAAAVIVFGVVGLNEMISPVILRAVLVRSGEAGKKAIAHIAH